MKKMIIITVSALCCTLGQSGLYAGDGCSSCHKCTSCHSSCNSCDSGCMSWIKFWEWGCDDCKCHDHKTVHHGEMKKVEAAPVGEPTEIKVEEGIEK
jgi:hypothetical protein